MSRVIIIDRDIPRLEWSTWSEGPQADHCNGATVSHNGLNISVYYLERRKAQIGHRVYKVEIYVVSPVNGHTVVIHRAEVSTPDYQTVLAYGEAQLRLWLEECHKIWTVKAKKPPTG